MTIDRAWNDKFPPLNLFNWPSSMTKWVNVTNQELDEINKEWLKHHMDKIPQTNPVYKNKREEVLTEAMSIVSGARADTYGGPEDSFAHIANFWSAYKGHAFSMEDVAIMLALLKIARLKKSPDHKDSWVDLAGYAACGAECALK